MPEDEEYERRPKLSMHFVEDPKEMKTEVGFKGIIEDEKKGPKASYVNVARVQIEHPNPIVPNDGDGNIQRGQYGGWAAWRMTDFDHGHQMIAFFSERKNKDSGEWEWSYIVKEIKRHIREQGLSEDNWRKFIFELGKKKSRGGNMGQWYVRLESTTADTPGMFDDPEDERFKGAIFEINAEEEKIVQKINKHVKKDGIPASFCKAMFLSTFTSGAFGVVTKESRAEEIWRLAKENPEKTKLDEKIIEAIKGIEE